MIYAYPPITAVNSYQTHKDYYRVSGIRGIAGGKSTTIREQLNLPYEGSPYQKIAKAAAQNVAGFVQTAQNAKLTAQSLVQARPGDNNRETILEPIREFVDTYNELQTSLRESPAYMNRSLLAGLEQAAKPYSLKEIGIDKLDDGSLEFQEQELQGQVNSLSSSFRKSLDSLTSFASTLANNLGQLQQVPSEALFQMSHSDLKPYGQYRSKLQAYLPVPMRGLLLDTQM
ncbi:MULTISPECIES: hypothetical protein [Paenibacillus]|uniref:Uncharacterized protein n=1 Tax=Paenibacillus violae TaxID=3077234 RepID=A0ABU3RFV1_9BACL|nr:MULTISPECIES: hypothetical protein [Paenibacillus]MDU0202951.1 hypothetical protein [Paenibacillus sp. PFR10]MEC0265715.1 hypothetical protein [Paenibacillus anseongense]